MAWIETINENDAQGELKQLYNKCTEPWGGVDNVLKIHSLNPPSLAGHLALYKSVMHGKSPLSRAQREMIGVYVSHLNECHY